MERRRRKRYVQKLAISKARRFTNINITRGFGKRRRLQDRAYGNKDRLFRRTKEEKPMAQ